MSYLEKRKKFNEEYEKALAQAKIAKRKRELHQMKRRAMQKAISKTRTGKEKREFYAAGIKTVSRKIGRGASGAVKAYKSYSKKQEKKYGKGKKKKPTLDSVWKEFQDIKI